MVKKNISDRYTDAKVSAILPGAAVSCVAAAPWLTFLRERGLARMNEADFQALIKRMGADQFSRFLTMIGRQSGFRQVPDEPCPPSRPDDPAEEIGMPEG